MISTLAHQCALDIQTDELLRKGVFAILKADHVYTFEDGSMLLDVHKGEIAVDDVMARHGYTPYEMNSKGAEQTYWNLRRAPRYPLFVSQNGAGFHVVVFTGWEHKPGNKMRIPSRFLEVEDVTKTVLAANEAEEISDEDLEAAAEF